MKSNRCSCLSIAVAVAVASTGFTGEDFKAGHHARPPINPDFDPDYSCLFDVYQEQCIPGSEQECPENFGNNDDSTCFPLDENGDWVCPESYHSIEDDETGQCYPDSEECPEGMHLQGFSDKEGHGCMHIRDCFNFPESAHCTDRETYCNIDENSESDYCMLMASGSDLCWEFLDGSKCGVS